MVVNRHDLVWMQREIDEAKAAGKTVETYSKVLALMWSLYRELQKQALEAEDVEFVRRANLDSIPERAVA